ncbi:methyltransferase type 12 [Niveomyces insectorum RCEF 264]|uniref:Methyltransferase type 12 n=1 Tax=Niveomyces insectorum RCEF 264 TaxID=1081102 RepID=A0A167VQS5_9HYPO|nr:methyltransferase type 12 [Niveomyces insectorum RCEF 264]
MAETQTQAPASAPPSSTLTPNPDPAAPLSAAEVFDSVGPAYEDAFAGLATQAAALQWLLTQLPAGGGGSVLDVGCGTGRPAASVLADAGHDVLGIDVSPAMIAAARERVPNARFELADVRTYLAQDTPDKDGLLDAVTIFFSLIADVTQADIRAVLAGLARRLKPGGTLVFSTVPLPVENAAIRWMGRPLLASSLAPDEALAAVAAAGLDVVNHTLTTFTPHAAEVGLCGPDEVWEETHLFVYAKKPLA